MDCATPWKRTITKTIQSDTIPESVEHRQRAGDDAHRDRREHEDQLACRSGRRAHRPTTPNSSVGTNCSAIASADGEAVVVRQVQHQPAERDRLHPRAAQRDALADEEQAEVAHLAASGTWCDATPRAVPISRPARVRATGARRRARRALRRAELEPPAWRGTRPCACDCAGASGVRNR